MRFLKNGKSKCSLILNILVTMCSLPLYGSSAAAESEENSYLRITENEKAALEKFKGLVRPFLTTNFQAEDIYLIRWLRSRNLDIPKAQQMLLENLRWRRENSIDLIIQEDFSDMKEDYPYSFDAHDLYSRPIGTLDIGQWNLRRAALSGRMPRLIRYMTKLLETNTNSVVDSIYQGKNITDFVIIANLEGFNMIQHACPLCMSVYTALVRTVQSYYPGYTNQFILINTPPTFKTVLDTLQPTFSPRTKRLLKVFGRDRSQWMEYLQRSISKEELLKVFKHLHVKIMTILALTEKNRQNI